MRPGNWCSFENPVWFLDIFSVSLSHWPQDGALFPQNLWCSPNRNNPFSLSSLGWIWISQSSQHLLKPESGPSGVQPPNVNVPFCEEPIWGGMRPLSAGTLTQRRVRLCCYFMIIITSINNNCSFIFHHLQSAFYQPYPQDNSMKWVLFSFIDEKKEPRSTSSRSQVKIGRIRPRALAMCSVRIVGTIRGPAAVTHTT